MSNTVGLISSLLFIFSTLADDCNQVDYEKSLNPEVVTFVEDLYAIAENISVKACFDKYQINKDSGTPEKQMQTLMSELSDEEVFTRLIMAEMIASTCPSKEVAIGIAWVLKNRVKENSKSKFGLGRAVIFKDYQFRSSTGSCDVAKREIFLCPERSDNFKLYRNMAKEAYANAFKSNEENPIPGSTLYFFYKHFDKSVDCSKWKGSTPAWAKEENEVLPENLSLDNSCVKFYRD